LTRAGRFRRPTSQQGQALPLVGLMLALLIGAGGLAVDLGHEYSQQRLGQTAVDDAALAGANELQVESQNTVIRTLPLWNDPAVMAAHDYANANGFPTVWPAAAGSCTPASINTATQFSEEFFDPSYKGSCSATPSNFVTEVIVNVPPRSYAGSAMPKSCDATLSPPGYPDNCVQVVVVQQVTNYLMQIFGARSEFVTTFATGYARPLTGSSASPPPGTASLPASTAVQLYQRTSVQAGCSGTGLQCFNETIAPARTSLSCTAAGDNCPTVFAAGGSAMIDAALGTNVQPASAHATALETPGDVVNRDNALTLCEPDPTATPACTAGSPAPSSHGFMLGPNANLYCTALTTNPAGGMGQSCTNNVTLNGAGPATVAGDPVAYAAPATWAPAAPPTPKDQCGGLILNGDPITAANVPPVFFAFSGGSWVPTLPDKDCIPDATEPFTIVPGQYSFIVINFGQYRFEDGLYDITGNAPVNTNTITSSLEPNGIDHSQEACASVTGDWDLCPAGGAATSQQTAGVWIGQGSSLFKIGALTTNVPTVCDPNGSYAAGTVGGGGTTTNVTGNGVSFRFESGSKGFVSTAEAGSVALSAPEVGTMNDVSGEPMLFDVENPHGYVHLDGKTTASFSGLVYQAPPDGTGGGGGVDIDPGVGANGATLNGQVLAYSMSLFGRGSTGVAPVAIDFSQWWGSGAPQLPGSRSVLFGLTGKAQFENSMITIPAGALQPGPTSSTETVHFQYDDETMLDAYDLSITVGSGPKPTSYFSQDIWTYPPNTGRVHPPLPVQGVYPSDTNPMFGTKDETNPPPSAWKGGLYLPTLPYYDADLPPSYTNPSTNNDVQYTTPAGNGSGNVFEVNGDWMWGNQTNLIVLPGMSVVSHPRRDIYSADIYYTFPIPPGPTVSVSLHAVDGDHCGDWDNVKAVFTNIGQSGGGSSGGLVSTTVASLVQ